MRVRYFLIILAFIIIFLGCGGGGGGGSGVGPVLLSGKISGSIHFDESLLSEIAGLSSDSSLRASNFNDAVVFLEEKPNIPSYPDANGRFSFTDLEIDTNYHILVRVRSLTGKIYKVRTEPFYISSHDKEIVKNISVAAKDEAKYKMFLQVKDTSDRIVEDCDIWLWGEKFSIGGNGRYTSPLMPYLASGSIRVVPPAKKELANFDCRIDSSLFQSEKSGVSAVTLLPYGIKQKKAPYVSIRAGDEYLGGSKVRIYGNAVDPQNDTLEYEWRASVSSFTYQSFDKSYVEWAVPSEPTEAIITFEAKQVSSYNYPMLSSLVELPIRVSSGGHTSYPDEIIVAPTVRTVNIVSTASIQITGDTAAMYEAEVSFPNDLPLVYSWEASDGFISHGKNSRIMCWNSPSLIAYESRVATLTLSVTEGIATVTKKIEVTVTSFPTVTIINPTEENFYPGEIIFKGTAKDYMSNPISPDFYYWYVATSSAGFEKIQSAGNTFVYNFVQHGSYTIALEAEDGGGTIGTFTKKVNIMDSPPNVVILEPRDDSGYLSGTSIAFRAKVTDYEEGEITSAEQITWFSDLQGKIGSGNSFSLLSLSEGKHNITVVASDSLGNIGEASIVIWYDMPARITLEPENGSVFFGNEITFVAKGVDVDNQPLDVSKYKWYLDGSSIPWKTGIDRFTTSELPVGNHTVKIVGLNNYGEVSSRDYSIEVGWPKPVITSPAFGTRFDPGVPMAFTATPVSTGTLELKWFVNNEEMPNNSGANFIANLEVGKHSISYEGTDASGIKESSKIEITVERVPIIDRLSIADGSYFFTGENISFSVDCKDSNGNQISDENVRWYLLDSGSHVFWKKGKSFLVEQGDLPDKLPPGEHNMELLVKGPYGTIASRTFSFVSGVERVKIKKPRDHNSFVVGENIEFLAVPSGNVPLKWYANNSLISGASNFSRIFNASDSYIIKVIGTDSAGVVSFDEIQISVGKFPIMDFEVYTTDENNKIDSEGAVFFVGQDITLVGSGTDPISGNPIASSNMSWRVYKSDSNTAIPLGDYNKLTVGFSDINSFGVGSSRIELRGSAGGDDTPIGKKIKTSYFNLPRPKITEPSDGSIFPIDSLDSALVTVKGTPEVVEPIRFEWWLNFGEAEAVRLEDEDSGNTYGSTMKVIIPKGRHNLTFIGTDSAGLVCSDSIEVVVSNKPVFTVVPKNNSAVFMNKSFSVSVEGEDVVKENVQWGVSLVNGALIAMSGSSPYTFSEAQIAALFNQGENYYEIVATAANELGVASTAKSKIYYGLKDANILSPLNNSVFSLSETPVFTALPAVGDPNGASSSVWLVDGEPIPGSENKTTISLSEYKGLHQISYVATDSVNNSTSSSIQVLFDDPPSLSCYITPANKSSPTSYSFPAYIFKEKNFKLVATGTDAIPDSEEPLSKFKWYLNEDYSVVKAVGGSILGSALNLPNGKSTVTLTGEDSFGLVGTYTFDVYCGEEPAVISSPNDGEIFSPSATITLEGEGSANIPMSWEIKGEGGSLLVYNENPKVIAGGALDTGRYKITYKGRDSADNEASSTVAILIDTPPVMNISLTNIENNDVEADKTIHFTLKSDEAIKFKGSGKDANNVGIDPASMTWKLYKGSSSGVLKYGSDGVSTLCLKKDTITEVGTYTLVLTGEDSWEVVGTKVISFYYGYKEPEITSPVNGSLLLVSAGESQIDVALSAKKPVDYPDVSIPMEWYKGAENIASGYGPENKTFSRGEYSILLKGKDSAGRERQTETSFAVNGIPVVNIIKPVAGGKYFSDQTLSFSGTVEKCSGESLSGSKVAWYCSSSADEVGNKIGDGLSISVDAATLGTGNYYIRLVGVDDDFSGHTLVGSASVNVDLGIEHPKILTPASGSRFDNNAIVAFSGNGLSGITGNWSSDDLKLSGSGQSASTDSLTRGWRTITYSGTDSAATSFSDSINVLIDTPPAFTLFPNIISPQKYGSGMLKPDGEAYPIFIASEGTKLNFVVNAIDSSTPPTEIASITWINTIGNTVVSGSVGSPNDFRINTRPGSYTYSIIIEDSLGVQASTTYSFWVWDCETYSGLGPVSSIISISNSSLIVASGTNSIAKFSRKSALEESSIDSGDINPEKSTDPASFTPGYYLMGIDFAGSTVYSISGDGTGGLRYQEWKSDDFETSEDNDITLFSGANLKKIGGFVRRNGNFYVSSKDDNRFKKLSGSTGTYITESDYTSEFMGIEYIDDGTIYVADVADNKIIRFNGLCNQVYNLPNGIDKPTDMTISADKKRLYVVSSYNNKIYVIDLANKTLLYSFGKTGSTPHQGLFGNNGACDAAISGSGELSDLYITDKTNGCILRFRCGNTW